MSQKLSVGNVRTFQTKIDISLLKDSSRWLNVTAIVHDYYLLNPLSTDDQYIGHFDGPVYKRYSAFYRRNRGKRCRCFKGQNFLQKGILNFAFRLSDSSVIALQS